MSIIAVKKILLGYSTVNPSACIFDIYEDLVDERIWRKKKIITDT